MNSWFERQFKLSEHGTDVRKEIMAGITTFVTMAYIIFVNPRILSETGMPFGSVLVARASARRSRPSLWPSLRTTRSRSHRAWGSTPSSPSQSSSAWEYRGRSRSRRSSSKA